MKAIKGSFVLTLALLACQDKKQPPAANPPAKQAPVANQKPLNPVGIFKKTKSKSDTHITNAVRKAVVVADMQRMKQLHALALQYKLIHGSWPASQAKMLDLYPEAEQLFAGPDKKGVSVHALTLGYQPPKNLKTEGVVPILFVLDPSGQPDINEMKCYTDGQIKKPR